MVKRYSIAQAKNRLPAIIHEVETTRVIELTRRGQSVAVIMAIQEYDRLLSPGRGFWQAYQAYVENTSLADLQLEPKELFSDLRDRSGGRQVSL